jgi:hypothetical protein
METTRGGLRTARKVERRDDGVAQIEYKVSGVGALMAKVARRGHWADDGLDGQRAGAEMRGGMRL